MNLRFSGHDTFHCKQQWLLKGVRLIEEYDISTFNDTSSAIKILGVGKNMVSSVKHWLESFYITDSHQITKIGQLLFGKNGLDNYLEDEGSLWLLQFYLCHTKYASIFNVLFTEYFKDKVSYHFTEDKVIKFLNKYIEENSFKPMSPNTLSNDFKVLTRSYVSSVKDNKMLEDDFNSPLLELNLIDSLEKNSFKLNKVERTIPPLIFAYTVLEVGKSFNQNSLSFKSIQETIGNYFCLTNDCLEAHVYQLNKTSPMFVFNEDGGTANIQIRDFNEQLQQDLLISHYAN